MDGKTLWNCYKASCTAKGVYSGPRTIEEAKAYMAGKNKTKFEKKTTPLPTMVTSIDNHPAAVEYIKSVNSYEAYQDGSVTLKYCPNEDRVLFYTHTSEGAVGRSLSSRGPKWWSYGNTQAGVHVGKGSTAVLVEDAASACAVSRCNNTVGVALLGTNLTKDLEKSLNSYNKIIIVLDNDAKQKAVFMCRALSKSTTMRITKLDLKVLNLQDTERLLNDYY
jgi:exonuclease VII small subunit